MTVAVPDRSRHLAVLAEIAGIPTASFHEVAAARYVHTFLESLGLTVRRDAWGNLLAEYSAGGVSRPPLVLVAHLDHPALEVSAVDGGFATARLLGGIPAACFARPVPVRLIRGDGTEASGRVVGCAEPEPRQIELALEVDGAVSVGDFGVFDLPSFRQDGDLLHLRAADDLAGCAAILLALEALVQTSAAAHVVAAFTRAEEVGLVGAYLLAESGALPRDAVIVSLETSKELPGATIGGGPVIRVGDRAGSFHPEAEAVLLSARAELEQARPGTRIQRQLMSGGTCEATAFGLLGYRATGVALPLGNYHNVGPGDTILPEYISAADFSGAVDLLVAAATVPGDPTADLRARLDRSVARLRDRLAGSASDFPASE